LLDIVPVLNGSAVFKAEHFKTGIPARKVVLGVRKNEVTSWKARTIFTRGEVEESRLNSAAKPSLPS
jgi:hypothetical protein